MKKRIFAILCIILTLSLSALPAFAASTNHDKMKKEKVYSYSKPNGFGFSTSSYHADTVTLEEGLYFVSFSIKYCEGELNDVGLYFKNFSNTTFSRTIYSVSFWADFSDSFYIYVTSPIDIQFHSTSGTSVLSYVLIDIWSTKTYEEIYDIGDTDGYNRGLWDGYSEGFSHGNDSGYGDGYAAGIEDGYGVAFNEGYDEGYDYGLVTGEEMGYNNGYTNGEADGYTKGKTDGYTEGRKVAQDAAYAQGKQDGWNEAIQDSEEVKTAIGGIFSGVFDGIVDSFNELTEGVTLIGLTLKQILLTIAGIGIIGLVIVLLSLKK